MGASNRKLLKNIFDPTEALQLRNRRYFRSEEKCSSVRTDHNFNGF